MAERKKIGILISGRGSNMAALIAASRAPDCPYEVALVLSNKTDAPGLAHARAEGVATAALSPRDHADRTAFDAAMHRELHATNCDFVALAGYMRLLSDDFVRRWEGRMVNIHPSLLPAFKGLHTHQGAIDAGCRVHGCTVHFVTAELDSGPIIAQAAISVGDSDTAQTLAERVLVEEHRLYPLALAALARGSLRVAGQRVLGFEPPQILS